MTASIATHNRNRALPMSAIMLPTEGDNQDMVGLGTHSAFDLYEVTENYARIVSSMLLATAQALEIRGIEKASTMGQKMHAFVRKRSAFLDKDRPLYLELEILYQDILNGTDLVRPWFLDAKRRKEAQLKANLQPV